MGMRRITRLTNAHSKKREKHKAAFALWFAYYDFSRPRQTLTERIDFRKTTPAMEAGLTDHVWTVAKSLERMTL
jgi:hypothetical protein